MWDEKEKELEDGGWLQFEICSIKKCKRKIKKATLGDVENVEHDC